MDALGFKSLHDEQIYMLSSSQGQIAWYIFTSEFNPGIIS